MTSTSIEQRVLLWSQRQSALHIRATFCGLQP